MTIKQFGIMVCVIALLYCTKCTTPIDNSKQEPVTYRITYPRGCDWSNGELITLPNGGIEYKLRLGEGNRGDTIKRFGSYAIEKVNF